MCVSWGNFTFALSVLSVLTAASLDARAGIVNLELRPVTQTIIVGDPVEVGLYAVSANGQDQTVGFIGVVVTWDAGVLALTGNNDDGAFTWASSGFPSDPADLNDTFSDGNAYYQAIVAEDGGLATATADGALMTTLQFTALSAATGSTSISLVSCIDTTCTLVLDRHPLDSGVLDITGSLGGPVDVTVQCETDPQCDDGNPCTDDTCDVNNLCAHIPNDANNPDDGLFCNGEEICYGGQIVIVEGSIPDCDDDLICTTDTCNETTDQCDHDLEAGYCLIAGACHADTSINPANDCEACDSAGDPENWSSRLLGAACGDTGVTECDAADTCDGFGTCQDNLYPEGTACGNATDTDCTSPDTCDGTGTCQPNHAANGTLCDDGLFCTVTDMCATGLCVGTGLRCPDQVCDESADKCKAVNLGLGPQQQGPVVAGEIVEIDLYAVSETATNQPISALSAIVVWDSSRIELLGNVDNGPYNWLVSGFPDDSQLDGLNNTFLDGNALYQALMMTAPNPPAIATTEGLWVTTLQFRALSAGMAEVDVIAACGQSTETVVLDAETLGLDITGTLGPPATVDIIECFGDEDCDDGEFCTGVETCIDSVCVAGTTPDCDDGLFCNGVETCEPGVGCVSPGNPCPDPDSCDDVADNCGGCDAPMVVAEGCRYLAVTPTAGEDPVTLLVAADRDDPNVSCVSRYVQADGSLDVDPVYQTPAQWGTVHVFGMEIVPSTKYEVHTDCRFEGSGFLSSAARATTWIWGDVNNDGAAQIDDVTLVYDGSQDIFPDGVTLENLDVSPCLPDGVIDTDDVAAVEQAYMGAPYPCPVPCEACFSIDPPQPEPNAIPKNRFFAFVRGNPGDRTAIRVTFMDLPPPHDVANGRTMWVGKPREVTENSGYIIPSEVPGWPTFWTAMIQCEPHFADWSMLGTVQVRGEGIVPEAVYELQAIRETCDLQAESHYSTSLQASTCLWGDIVEDCTTTPCGPPDGTIGVTTDVTAVLDKFKNEQGAPVKARCDIEPNVLDLKINISDVSFVLDAFRGWSYPFEGPGPVDPCP